MFWFHSVVGQAKKPSISNFSFSVRGGSHRDIEIFINYSTILLIFVWAWKTSQINLYYFRSNKMADQKAVKALKVVEEAIPVVMQQSPVSNSDVDTGSSFKEKEGSAEALKLYAGEIEKLQQELKARPTDVQLRVRGRYSFICAIKIAGRI